MSNRYQVSEAAELMPFLLAQLEGWSRNNVKQRLQLGCIVVNGSVVRKPNHPLQIGDDVEVIAKELGAQPRPQHGATLLEILFADDDLVAIHKPAGLLSVGSDTEEKRHALALLRQQLSRPRCAVQLWPVHRLDRDTSGVLLFATSATIRDAVSAAWAESEKTYLAVVEGIPQPSVGTIDQPLRMNAKGFRAHVGAHPQAKHAITHFQTLHVKQQRALLELQIETGRQHQIRAHLAWLGHPVVGDSRYGTADRRLGLHALRLRIPALHGGARMTFEAPVPAEFSALLR
jgi:23S rRNA pseudouridine1911/1915/1917 synthase